MASHLLLWSGGFDSTAILLDMVSRPEEYTNVRVVSCGLKNAFNYEEDKKARDNIKTILDIANKPHINLKECELDINTAAGIQSSIWATLSAMNISDSDEGIVLTYGFIRGDDFWHYRHDFESAVKYLTRIHCNVTPKFSYPLEWKYKKEFVKWYLHYPSVFNALSWGGDTATTKSKEKEELEFLYYEMLASSRTGVKSDENKEREDRSKVTIETLQAAADKAVEAVGCATNYACY